MRLLVYPRMPQRPTSKSHIVTGLGNTTQTSVVIPRSSKRSKKPMKFYQIPKRNKTLTNLVHLRAHPKGLLGASQQRCSPRCLVEALDLADLAAL